MVLMRKPKVNNLINHQHLIKKISNPKSYRLKKSMTNQKIYLLEGTERFRLLNGKN
jgi:hypothetical protein